MMQFALWGPLFILLYKNASQIETHFPHKRQFFAFILRKW